MATNVSDEYLAGYVIEFSDGGPPEGQILHRGTKETCEQVVALLTAVSYSGDRPLKSCYMKVVPAK